MRLLGDLPALGIISTLEESSTTHFIKPTSLIRMIQEHYPREFELRFGAEPRKVRSFWNMFFISDTRADWASQHPFLKGRKPADLERTLPLVVHQDGGPCSKVRSADCISFGSMLGEGSEKITKFLLSTCLDDPDNDWKIWEAILSDLDEAATMGVGGWYFCLLFAKADELQRSIKWGLPSYNDPMEVCSECLCNRTNRPHTDLSRGALWRPTETMPPACYLARIKNDPRHPLAASKYFTRWFFSWILCIC